MGLRPLDLKCSVPLSLTWTAAPVDQQRHADSIPVLTLTSPAVRAQAVPPSLRLEACATASAVGLLPSQDSSQGLDINS